jgi:multiple sugar transport system permease protein
VATFLVGGSIIAMVWKIGRSKRERLMWGLLFTLPWTVGLAWLHAYPIGASLAYSFLKYDLMRPARWVGLANYAYMIRDRHYMRALENTLWFVVIAVPINIAFSFLVAIILNQRLILRSVLRTVVYLPTIVPPVASAMVWLWVFNPYGLINGALAQFGVEAIPWLSHPSWTKPALTIVTLWISGSNIVIFLAALQDVPQQLREAARIDGANWVDELIHITVPCVSPAILFTLITGMIWAFQQFTFAYIISGRGPLESTLFYAMYIFDEFRAFRMGYAAAMAWVLFVIIALFTLALFRSSARWVYYGGEA